MTSLYLIILANILLPHKVTVWGTGALNFSERILKGHNSTHIREECGMTQEVHMRPGNCGTSRGLKPASCRCLEQPKCCVAQTYVHRISDAIQPSHPLATFSSYPQCFPASGSFPMSWLFTSDGILTVCYLLLVWRLHWHQRLVQSVKLACAENV